MMLIGLVAYFDTIKGYGFVGTPNGDEYFLHINSFVNKPNILLLGTPIFFNPKKNKEKNRTSAINSRLIGFEEDWKIIFSYLDKSDLIFKHPNDKNNGFLRKVQCFSLIEKSLEYFFQDKTEEEIINFITDYFDKNLDKKLFISFCEKIEKSLSRPFPIVVKSKILDKIFFHFSQNLTEELQFTVWKYKKFKFISINELEDYEISENVLKKSILEIGKAELNRILKFSFGSEFCSYYVNYKFSNLDILTSTEIEKLYQFVDFETETKREKRKHQLDHFYVQKIETELTEKTNKLDVIKNSDDFNNYNSLLQFIPNQFTVEDKIKITETIHKIIARKCSDGYKVEIWVKGIIKEISFDLVTKYFLDKDTQTEKRLTILTKLETIKQFELLKKCSDEFNFEKAFELLKGLLKKENSLDPNLDFSKILIDREFWKDKKGSDLILLFTNYINTQSNEEQKYELFLKGYLKNVPQNIVRQKIDQLENEDCKKIFKNISENESLIKDILTKKVTQDKTDSFSWLYDLAKEFLSQENFNDFDKKVFDTIEQFEYFKFWEKGQAKIFPQNQINEILQDKFENYTKIKNWIDNNPITSDKISNHLFSFLQKHELVTDRIVFYKQINHIKYLLQLDESYLDKIKQLQNDFYIIILWVLDKVNFFDFELLKQKFIYFAPDEQVRIVRKLFFLKAIGQFNLTVEKLNELTRFDLDLYYTNLEYNPEISVDISTDIVIKALLSFHQKKRYLDESELLTIILKNLKFDKTRRFQFTNYFEKCLGRLTAEYNWNTNGKISKVKFGDKFYFAISFEYNSNLVDAVKSLPGKKWNDETKVWGVPSQYETEVLNFAIKYRFFLDFEGSKYTNNIHLSEFKRTIKQGNSEVPNIPKGISLCEGRLANKPHKNYNIEFWWCGGEPCFSKCETIHNTDEWELYTFLDFCEILGLNLDETNKMGDYIPKGHYYQFMALINRFNRLLKKLYCQDCNHILYPSDFGTSHFAAHTIVRFQCRNESCSNNDEIYLNHCLNGKCNCIIDSRVSKRCDNGLFICDTCGSCCSHNMLERRLSNLKLTGGYIHDNLVKCVNEKLGHLERGEYFCYKCKSEMKEISNDIFQCSSCNVRYDTRIYNLKRPHKYI
jgi:cold shock CspA family protein